MNILLTDQELVSAYRLGDQKAIEILINRHKKNVFRYIYSKVKDKDISDDIFQETFIKVIIALRKNDYDEQGKFLPWVKRIANNLTMDYFRASSKTNRVFKRDDNFIFNNYLKSDFLDLTEIAEIEYNLAAIMILLEGNLLPEQREVIELRIKQKMMFKEIALIQGVSVNTALGRYRYGIENLKKEIIKNKIKIY